MSSKIDPVDAFRYALGRIATRGGALLLVAYVLFQLVTQVAFQSLFARLFATRLRAGTTAPREVFPLAIDLPVAASGGLTVLLLLGGTVLGIVAMRAFYRDIDSVPTTEHTRRLGRTVLVTVAVSFVVSVAVMVGFVLLVIPGIFLAVSLGFAVLVVAIEDAGVVEALERSWELSRGNRIRLFVLGLVLVVASMVISVVLTVLEFVSPLAGDVGGALLSAVTGVFGIALLVGAYRQLTTDTEHGTPPAPASNLT